MMSRAWLSSFVIVAACSTAASAADFSRPQQAAGDWPQWRGPDRSGISPDVGLLRDWEAQQPKLLWISEGMGVGYASVAVADGRIHTTGNQVATGDSPGRADGQAVICVNSADGKVLWTQRVTETVPRNGNEIQTGSRSTPSVDGQRLYAIASSGKIVCLQTADGSEVWSKDFRTEWGGRMMSGWGFSESPLVDGDWVLCTPGAADAMIVALDKLTGKEIWRTSVPKLGDRGKDGAGYSSIVVSNACGVKQYVQLVGRGVIGVRASDGAFLWNYNDIANNTANIPTPIVTGDYVFCSTGYRDGGSALLRLVQDGDGIKAEEVYYHPANILQNHHGQMILLGRHIYCGHGHNNGIPTCVELETGKIAWGGTRGPGRQSAAVTCADGLLFFRYQSGEVALIEATPGAYRLKGVLKPEFVGDKPCWAQPVVIGGRLYLRDQDKLMCYDVRAGESATGGSTSR